MYCLVATRSVQHCPAANNQLQQPIVRHSLRLRNLNNSHTYHRTRYSQARHGRRQQARPSRFSVFHSSFRLAGTARCIATPTSEICTCSCKATRTIGASPLIVRPTAKGLRTRRVFQAKCVHSRPAAPTTRLLSRNGPLRATTLGISFVSERHNRATP